MGIRYSVGFVALKEELSTLEELRAKISPSIYVWANAYKRIKNYYSPKDIHRITQVDPLFSYNTKYHPSFGKSCQAGNSSFTVDGDGNIRRCHFIQERIGNIYSSDFYKILQARLCSQPSCGCHIGYVHLEELNLYETFGDGILERIPRGRG